MSISLRISLLSLLLIAFSAVSGNAQTILVGDLDGNYRVDSRDLRFFARQWLDEDCLTPGCDSDLDNVDGVNMADLALLAKNFKKEELHLVISEIMASNDSEEPLEEGELLDSDGDSSDWIEIYNPMDASVNLEGWSLVYEDNANQAQWYFPAYELGSGEFLVVFASGKNRLDPNEMHTNFELNMDGAYLALVGPDGNTVIHEFAPEYPRQLTNISYGLSQYARTLVPSGGTATYHVPTISDTALGTDWTDLDFDDSQWDVGKTCIGFGFGDVPMTAYNDCVYRSSDQYIGENVTTYGIGNGYGGPTSGPLVDRATGDNMGITAALTQSGGVTWQADPSGGGSDCAVGTDAYNTFGGITDMTGVIYYGSTGWWVDLTFTGLDPSTEYAFATSANRGNPTYTDRWAIYTLTGADTYSNASTSGVDVLAANKVRFNTGDNYSTGYVARWTGITAADGTFTVRAEADPSSSEGRKAYSFDVFRLEGGFQGTDVEDDMLGVNASLWMRTEFVLEEGESAMFDSLTLRMKYEDGFVAYLNGQKIAGKNAPDPVQWNSTALTDRPMEDAAVFEVINLTAYINALQDGRNVLAVHGLNDSATDPNFLILPELDAASNMTVPQYFTQPTPEKFNVSGAIGIVSDVWFSHERGFYDTGFELILSTALDDAEIRYTTDGSRPTITHGNTYTSPIDISSTSTIRAVAIKPGWLDSDVETHTYIFLDDVIAQSPNGEVPPGWPPSGVNGQTMQYGMDPAIVNDPVWGPQLKSALLAIPTMSIVTDLDNLFDSSIGIYVNAGYHGYAWERLTSLELIYPPNLQGPGFPDLVPVPDGAGGVRQGLSADMRGGFQIDAGIRIRGGFSRSDGNPKHAFRLFFRNEYGAGKLRYPLFGDEGVDGFDKVDLRTSQNYSWSFQNDSYNTLCRDVWARDSQGLMGQAYTRSRYYHLYINGQYWGVFQTQERPEAAFGASYFGGDREEWDCVKATGPNAGYTIEATDGTLDDWQDLWELTNNLPGATVSQRTALYFQMQGLNTDGTRNPDYPVLLDVDNLIDYMIMVFYDGDLDAPVSWFLGNDQTNNWYGIRYRPGEEGFRYFVHDAEHIMRAAERTNGGVVNRTGPWVAGLSFQYSNPQWIHQRLMLIPEYRLRFADHAHKHLFNGGLLTANEAIERFQARAAQIDMAIIAESARWGNASLNKNTWLSAINNEITGFFPTRAGTVVNHLRNTTLWDGGAVAPLYPSVSAPTFNQKGGEVPSGFNLTINASSGTVYYTLDGSDPREPITGNPIGTQYGGQITLNKSTHVKARVLSGGTWSALNEAIFAIGPVADYLRITEIMYHPKDTGDPNDPNEEFIELKNIGKDTLSINLVRFTEGIDFTFPDIDLAPNECVVVVKDQSAFEAKYGTSVNVAGQYTGSLANNGEQIKLVDAIGRTILDFQYKDGWHQITDGDGFSLTIIDPTDKALYGSDQGLIAHWKLDDDPGSSIALDSAGTNDGDLNGDPTWTAGRIEGALSFDGDGDYVSLDPISVLAGDNFTVQAWVNVDESAGVWNPVMMQHDLSNDGCYFYISNDRPSFYIVDGSGFAQAASLEVINSDQWYHVAATNDGSDLKLFVDGQLKATASSVDLTGVNFDAYIGCEPVSLLYYNGLIDDVRIYNRALSVNEFQDIADPIGRWSRKSSWRPSVYRNGTPGADDSGILPNPSAVVINEVMSHSNEGPDWIELYNTTGESINIGGWFLSDNDGDEPNLMKYRIADGTIIYGDDYLVFYEDTDFNNLSDPGCLVPFALSENGEEACLSSYLDTNGMLTGYREVEDFGASATNVSLGRYFKSSTGNYNFVAMDYSTPDSNNAYPRVWPVVINEIMYNPPTGNQKEEYIELYNTTGVPQTLFRFESKNKPWKFTDGVDYTFSESPPVTILPHSYLLLVKDKAAFNARYGSVPGDVQVVGGYAGWLSNGGERLQIGMPGDLDEEGTRYYIRIDRVTYSDGSHHEDCPGGVDYWPPEADGFGKSLSRKIATDYGNDVANWEAADPSPGVANP